MSDVLLDTGCSRTLVRQELVLPEKLKEGRVAIRCACGDIVNYPLAEVHIEVGGRQFTVEAGASDSLPTSVLLGTDVLEMGLLLQENRPDTLVQEAQTTSDQALAGSGSAT